jgi:hypothetical protein
MNLLCVLHCSRHETIRIHPRRTAARGVQRSALPLRLPAGLRPRQRPCPRRKHFAALRGAPAPRAGTDGGARSFSGMAGGQEGAETCQCDKVLSISSLTFTLR